MGKVTMSLRVSLDGHIAGPDAGAEHLPGVGGERVFAWMNAGPESNASTGTWHVPTTSLPVVEGWMAGCGAIVSGRRTFDIAGGWKDGHPIDGPIFVGTHEAPTEGERSPQVRFVTDGIESALDQAKAVAGDKDVSVGAADPVQQLSRSGKIDEIEVSVTPCLPGGGVRLFDRIGADAIDLEQIGVTPSEGVTHLRHRVVR